MWKCSGPKTLQKQSAFKSHSFSSALVRIEALQKCMFAAYCLNGHCVVLKRRLKLRTFDIYNIDEAIIQTPIPYIFYTSSHYLTESLLIAASFLRSGLSGWILITAVDAKHAVISTFTLLILSAFCSTSLHLDGNLIAVQRGHLWETLDWHEGALSFENAGGNFGTVLTAGQFEPLIYHKQPTQQQLHCR